MVRPDETITRKLSLYSRTGYGKHAAVPNCNRVDKYFPSFRMENTLNKSRWDKHRDQRYREWYSWGRNVKIGPLVFSKVCFCARKELLFVMLPAVANPGNGICQFLSSR